MEAYSQQQLSTIFFRTLSPTKKWFWSLAAGNGRAALAIARLFLWPVVTKIGRGLIVQAAPKLVELLLSNTSKKNDCAKNCKKTNGRIKNKKNA